jgi:hypothetical protein
MNTELKARLDSLSERLKELGVVDIKLHVDKTGNPSSDKVASDVAEFIEAYLDGKTKPCFGIGDSNNPATIAYFAEKRRQYEAVHGPLN